MKSPIKLTFEEVVIISVSAITLIGLVVIEVAMGPSIKITEPLPYQSEIGQNSRYSDNPSNIKDLSQGMGDEWPTIAKPPVGVTARCVITEVYDGDTLTGELRIPFRVRLLDCWAPEVRTRDAAEKERGIAAKEFLASIAEGKQAIIHVPSGHVDRADGVMTFGRVLGYVWLKDGDDDLSTIMVKSGHATREN